MDRRELRNYVDMPHFHPEKNVISGVDVYKNGRIRHEIKHDLEHKTITAPSPLRIRSYSMGSEGEPTSPIVGSPSTSSGSPLSSSFSGGFLTKAFQIDRTRTSGEKHLKEELDFLWQ
ncbi:uncharacterized protein LOC133196707 [Saccostrea echinata]|uniref:uncharacterized protein LOC133196707 n=1 Tax=Saccostrea echinata TaxID=191078 RepID=UPI002A809C49|nr:uncharacterized protein LOC133196707 [Saccostrea echinata]